jgi:hypothetical protein
LTPRRGRYDHAAARSISQTKKGERSSVSAQPSFRPFRAVAESLAVGLAGSTLGLVAGPVGSIAGAAVAGLNGLVAGYEGLYDWKTSRGWLAFLFDSSWGLVGTALALALAAANVGSRRGMPNREMTRRRNRRVHEGGFALKRDFALTLGNTISNANPSGRGVNDGFLSRHEELHIWQSRVFGPLFPLGYVVWWIGGAVVATVVWGFHRKESWRRLVETAAYYHNPFEYWAYRNDRNWPPAGAHPLLAWRK